MPHQRFRLQLQPHRISVYHWKIHTSRMNSAVFFSRKKFKLSDFVKYLAFTSYLEKNSNLFEEYDRRNTLEFFAKARLTATQFRNILFSYWIKLQFIKLKCMIFCRLQFTIVDFNYIVIQFFAQVIKLTETRSCLSHLQVLSLMIQIRIWYLRRIFVMSDSVDITRTIDVIVWTFGILFVNFSNHYSPSVYVCMSLRSIIVNVISISLSEKFTWA